MFGWRQHSDENAEIVDTCEWGWVSVTCLMISRKQIHKRGRGLYGLNLVKGYVTWYSKFKFRVQKVYLVHAKTKTFLVSLQFYSSL